MRFSLRWMIWGVLLVSACGKASPPVATPAGVRIASTVPAATLDLVLIGGDKHLVGVGSLDSPYLPPDERNLPVVGDYVQTNYEQLVKLSPTVLIIQQRDVAPRMREFVADHHIELLNLTLNSVQDIWSSVRLLGKASGREAEAEKAIAEAQRELADVAVEYKDAEHPKVLYLMDPDSNLACGNHTFVEEMITMAGGTLAPVGDRFVTVSRETMVKLAPDVLLIGAPDGQPEEPNDRRLAPWLSLPVPATRNHRVFLVTDQGSQIPSLNIGKNVRALAELIHRNAPLAPAGGGRGP